MESTEQITQNTQTEQNQQTHQNHQPDQGRQTSQTNQSDRKDQQANHPQAGNAPWSPFQGQQQDGSTRSRTLSRARVALPPPGFLCKPGEQHGPAQ